MTYIAWHYDDEWLDENSRYCEIDRTNEAQAFKAVNVILGYTRGGQIFHDVNHDYFSYLNKPQ